MKRLRRRLLSLILVLTVVFSGTISVSAAQFGDTKSHWANEIIKKWSEYDVISGNNGKFRPDDFVTRAEFASILNNVMRYEEKGNYTYSDVKTTDWYYDTLIKLSTAGVMQGANGKAMPKNSIKRQEAAVMIARALNIKQTSGSTSFTDDSEIAEWAKGHVKTLANDGIVTGMPNGKFNPTGNLTRAEAVAMLNKSIESIFDKPNEYSKDIKGNLIINVANAHLKDMKVTGNIYVTQGVGIGEVYFDNVKILGDVYVEGGGTNSIVFNNVTVEGALVVNKYDNNVRILATGTTKVSVIVLESGAMVVTKELVGGGIQTVEISAEIAKESNIILEGNFESVINNSEQANIKADGTIKSLIANVDTDIEGGAKVESLTANSNSKVSVDGKQISETGQDDTSVTGSGGSGNRGGNTDPDPTPVAPATADDVFAAIEGIYLGSNTSNINITTNLNLITSLSAYPGVTITWESSSTGAISNVGVIARSSSEDIPVTLTVTLGGTLTGVRTFELMVKMIDAADVSIGDIDQYFADGYPQAYVGSNGKLWVRVKTTTDAEVFITVNETNGNWESTTMAVIQGRAGTAEWDIWIEKWPYINATQDTLYEFDTDVTVQEECRVSFVIKKETYVSPEVTEIHFTPEVAGALDTTPPYRSDVYINDAWDKIYIYYHEKLDTDSPPNISDFQLSRGSVSDIIICDYEETFYGLVILEVSGISEQDIGELKISYDGTAIRDKALEPNIAGTFADIEVEKADLDITEAFVSHDRTKMTVRVESGFMVSDGGLQDILDDLITVTADGIKADIDYVAYSYNTSSIRLYLRFNNPIAEGDVSIAVNQRDDVFTWAGDSIMGKAPATSSVTQIPTPGVPTAAYFAEEDNERIEITFSDSFRVGETRSAYPFSIVADETTYNLRGYILDSYDNTLIIYLSDESEERFKEAIESATTITLKYTKDEEMDESDRLQDAAGSNIESFGPISVVKTDTYENNAVLNMQKSFDKNNIKDALYNVYQYNGRDIVHIFGD